MRILTGTMLAGLLLACGGDVPRPAEIAQADQALVPIEDTMVDTMAPVEESTPAVEAPRPRARPTTPRAKRSAAKPAQVPPRPAAGDTAPAPDPAAAIPATDTLSPVDTVLPPDTAELATVPDTAPNAVSTVPAPARAPDTVGTTRPIPEQRPAPTVSDMSGPSATEAIPAGAELHAALVDSIHSRRDTAGHTVTARLMENVAGKDGRTLLPAGSTVQLTIVRLEPARSKSAADGRLELKVDGITAGGSPLDVAAEVRPVPHELRGRGVTGSEAAKVGAGAAAGAIAGRVLGGDTRGAVIGGVVGAAGGAAVASQTADRDVVVKAGTPVTFVLTAPLVTPRPLAP